MLDRLPLNQKGAHFVHAGDFPASLYAHDVTTDITKSEGGVLSAHHAGGKHQQACCDQQVEAKAS